MDSWFVYLYALSDCSAFKVGFTCHPLQRISTFSRRYFERFDLPQSLLLQLDDEAGARALESALKTELAAFRAEAPSWVPLEAGGHTEWFGSVYFGQAESRVRAAALDASRVLCAFDYVRAELDRSLASFELWAWRRAQEAVELRAAAHRGRWW